MKLWVIKETTPAGAKKLIRNNEDRLIVWEKKSKVKEWYKVLDEARGQNSTPLPFFGKSKFRIIQLNSAPESLEEK